jgi:hypothetical protein
MLGNSVDLLFPSRAIEGLQDLRSAGWVSLVSSVIGLEAVNPARIAFVLLMVRLGGCTSCQSDSYRAMRGCLQCASTTVKRYKGSDQSLIDLYNDAKQDVVKYINEV